MTHNRILIVDRSKTLSQLIERGKAFLGWADCRVVGVADCGQALDELSRHLYTLLITYDRPPGASQPAFLEAVHKLQPDLEIILLTWDGENESTGAYGLDKRPHEHRLNQPLLMMTLWELESRLQTEKRK